MAYSQDWSALGKYVRQSFSITRCLFLLETACLLFRLRLPGARKIFQKACLQANGRIGFARMEQPEP